MEQKGRMSLSSTMTGMAPIKIASARRYEWRPLPAGAAEKTEESISVLKSKWAACDVPEHTATTSRPLCSLASFGRFDFGWQTPLKDRST